MIPRDATARREKQKDLGVETIELAPYDELIGRLVRLDSVGLEVVIECKRRYRIRLGADDLRRLKHIHTSEGQDIALLRLEDGRILARPSRND